MWRRFGRTRTLSCLPKMTGRTCDPRCRRYSCGHVSLPLLSAGFYHTVVCWKHVRFGAVSSEITQFLALAVICRTVISKLTNARGLSDIDRQVCLRPGLPVSLNLQLVRESSRPRHIDIPRPTSTTSRTKSGVRGHTASSAPCSTAPRRCNRRPPPFVRWREVESRDGILLALMIGERKEKHPQLGCSIAKLKVKKIRLSAHGTSFLAQFAESFVLHAPRLRHHAKNR